MFDYINQCLLLTKIIILEDKTHIKVVALYIIV